MFILMLSFRKKTLKITSFAFRYARSKENEWIQATLKVKNQKALLAQDLIYEKIQKKNMDVMGLLGKLLQSLK